MPWYMAFRHFDKAPYVMTALRTFPETDFDETLGRTRAPKTQYLRYVGL